MVCSYCVYIMPDDSKYCPHCGRPTPLVGDVVDVIRSSQEIPIPTSFVPIHPVKLAPPPEEADSAPSRPQMSEAEVERQLSAANLHRLRKEWEKAMEICATILEAVPTNATAHSLLGDICREQNRLEDAHRWYRMAVTLKPNPSDDDKLKQVEALLAKKQSGGTQHLNPKMALPVHADGSVVSGTTQLGGVSPRRWLKAITLVSVVFMGVTVIALGAFQMGKRQNNGTPKALSTTSSFTPSTNPVSMQPQQRPMITTPAPYSPPPPVTTPTNEGGSGFAPDRTPSMHPQTPANAPNTPANGNGSSALPGLKPATVLTVMEHPTTIQLKSPEEDNKGDATHLPGDMWIANIQKDAKLPQAIVEVDSTLASKETLTEDQKRLILRNVYRSAQRVVKTDPTLKAVGLMVMSSGEKPNERTPLFFAEVETKALANMDIEKTPLNTMTEGLRDYKWASDLATPPTNQVVANTPKAPAPPATPKPYVYIEFAPTKN